MPRQRTIVRVPRAARVLALLPFLVLPACGRSDSGATREEAVTTDMTAAAPSASPAAPSDAAGFSASAVRRQAAPEAPPAPAMPPGAPGQATDTAVVVPAMLIRTGSAVIEVDSLELAIERVQALARQLGGFVANTQLFAGEGQARRAELVLRFPSSRFDQATAALRPMGTLESLVISSEDVGEEFVDVTARVTNARRLEARLIELLARRTGKLEDVLAVERELARVREEIERYEGRLRYLRSRVALSTLTITVQEPRPVFEPRPGPSRITEAFRDAWRNFVGFLAGLIASLGWVVPLAVIVAALVWLARRTGVLGRLPRRDRPTPPGVDRE